MTDRWSRRVVRATERAGTGGAPGPASTPSAERRAGPTGRFPEQRPSTGPPWLRTRPLPVADGGRLTQVVPTDLPVLKAHTVLPRRPFLLDPRIRWPIADLVVTTTTPPPRAAAPLDVGVHRLWPDPAHARALVSLTSLRLVGAAVTIQRDAQARISGGSATVTFSALPSEVTADSQEHAPQWQAALAAAGHDWSDWRYLALGCQDVQATVELPDGHAARPPRITTNPVAGSATALLDLTAEGARVWSQALSAEPRQDLGGLATVTLVSAVDGSTGLDVRRNTVGGSIGTLLQHLPVGALTHVNPTLSILARLVVDGDPTVATTVIDAHASSGTAINQVFGPEGGTVELTLNTAEPATETIHWTARVSFASGAWPVVRDSGTLSAADGWSDLVVPRSWTREIAVTAMLLGPDGGVLAADGAPAGDEVTATLQFTADYLNAPTGLRTSFQTANREHVSVRVPAPPGEDPGRATLTVMALRGPRDALVVRELTPDDHWVVVKVAHDAAIAVTTNRTPAVEASREAVVGDSLADLTSAPRPPEQGVPALRVPARAPRGGPAPVLRMERGAAVGYVVEVASSPRALVAGAAGVDETYWSSAELGLLATPDFPIPEDVWRRLAVHPVLVFRAWTSQSSTGWLDARVSTADEDVAATAPRIVVVPG